MGRRWIVASIAAVAAAAGLVAAHGVAPAGAVGVSIAVGDGSVWEGDAGANRSGSLAVTLSARPRRP